MVSERTEPKSFKLAKEKEEVNERIFNTLFRSGDDRCCRRNVHVSGLFNEQES